MDSEGFQRAVLEHKNRIFSYAVVLLRDPAEAQDVAQEALVRLWQHRMAVDPPGAGAWLRRTTHNLCIDRIRRGRVRPEVAVEDLDAASPHEGPGPQRLAESVELGREIGRALGKLSHLDRAVVVMREVQRLSYQEIAEALELPLGTLKARLHRAREQLRTKLTRAGVTP